MSFWQAHGRGGGDKNMCPSISTDGIFHAGRAGLGLEEEKKKTITLYPYATDIRSAFVYN
jgi:hypothetical protein